ncbi:hypothetical protein NOV72_05013 [Caballeronia novacaledonica]|uniref:Uncharacterized protein n=1 Tax=Caballeronia novacaledonica TaxID=1544861 RepID=A0A2U3IC72_9BURK|nr:hypothetical protein NOV72_05013 [Caballeronia novacaledonica]
MFLKQYLSKGFERHPEMLNLFIFRWSSQWSQLVTWDG